MKSKISLDLTAKWTRDGGEFFIEDIFIDNGPSVINDLDQSIITEFMLELEHDHAGSPKTKGEDGYRFEDIEVEVDYKFSKGTSDRYSVSHGQWLPGDPDDVQIKSITLGKTDISEFISDHDMDTIYDEIYENEGLDESRRHKNAIEKVEKRLESKLRRGKIKSKLVNKNSKIPGFSYWFKK